MDSQRLAVAAFMAVMFALLAFLLVAVDWAAASGRLRRNQWVGIRIPSTMRSDRAWVAGHQAALRLMPLHLLTGVGLLLAVLSAPTVEGVHLVGILGAAVFLVVAVITAIVAGRAAKAAEGESRG
jgi:p-aminobenzoyl-glutamate transporter AbgT